MGVVVCNTTPTPGSRKVQVRGGGMTHSPHVQNNYPIPAPTPHESRSTPWGHGKVKVDPHPQNNYASRLRLTNTAQKGPTILLTPYSGVASPLL